MSTNYVVKGDNSITWGSSAAVGYGVLVSAGEKTTGDKVTLTDEDGNVFAVIYFNDRNECTIEFIMQTTVTLPKRGDQISICSVLNALVDDFDKKWERGKEMMISLTATKYAFIALGS